MKRIKDKTWNTIDCARALSSDNPEGYKFAMGSAREVAPSIQLGGLGAMILLDVAEIYDDELLRFREDCFGLPQLALARLEEYNKGERSKEELFMS
jgi:hypothetical protein